MYSIDSQDTACQEIKTVKSPLIFKEITIDELPVIYPYLKRSGSMSCDYTAGIIYMWINYFKYHYCIYEDTLFIKGVAEDDRRKTAFAVPLGAMPLRKSVKLLCEYCAEEGITLEFSVVAEEQIDELMSMEPSSVSELDEWGDFIYNAESLATFKGKALKQKRNHVNRFTTDHPDAYTQPITHENLQAVRECFNRICEVPADSKMAEFERKQVWHILDNLDYFPFVSLCLFLGDKVIGFTIGEVIGNVLHDHIEKSLHDEYSGVNETLCRDFVASVMKLYPQVEFVNRQDAAGDEGLRQSKLSFAPVKILKKYNVIFLP